jgi:hypothetical protein
VSSHDEKRSRLKSDARHAHIERGAERRALVKLRDAHFSSAPSSRFDERQQGWCATEKQSNMTNVKHLLKAAEGNRFSSFFVVFLCVLRE